MRRRRWLVLGHVSLVIVWACNLCRAQSEPALLERAYELDAAQGVDRNASAAAALYLQAAQTGDPYAHLRYGYLAETGDGIPQDYAEAFRHYQAAANAGLAAARVRLALCHLEGWGTLKDRAAFVREIRSAAEAGDSEGQLILASAYFAGLGVPRDFAEASRWLERTAHGDNAEAQYALGVTIENMRRLTSTANLAAARKWYQRSAEQEYTAALVGMAHTFVANPADQDWAMAQRWLELADENGDREAPFVLAVVGLLRPGAAIEADRARDLLKRAAGRGNSIAGEIIEFANFGQTLASATQYVLGTAQADRYVERLRRKAGGDEQDRSPRPLKTVVPTYPVGMVLGQATGTVKAEFTVTTEGKVDDITIKQSPHPQLSDATRSALVQWQFLPARKNGRNIPARVALDVPFVQQPSMIEGADGLLQKAYELAVGLGTEVEADAVDMRLAEPLERLPLPTSDVTAAIGVPRALVLLVIDHEGRPMRAHVLEAEPAALGEEIRRIALAARFRPRQVAGSPVAASVVLPYFAMPAPASK